MADNNNASEKLQKGLGFNFDIVIVHINLTSVNVEENSKLAIDIKFNDNNIKITSSRINVDEFKSGRSFEFTEEPSNLKSQLSKNPLECQVHYSDKVVGTCTFLWPDSFIKCITEGCGRELTFCDEAELKKDNKVVGRMEIISRLQIKCHEFVENNEQLQPKINLCHPADNILNPNDVMFVVGENKYGSIACPDVAIIPASESATSAHATCLDLSEFRHVHGKIVSNTDILDSIDAPCCKTKKPSNQMLKKLFDQSQEPTTYSNNKGNKDKQQKMRQLSCEQQMDVRNFAPESRISSCSSSSTDSSQSWPCISDENVAEEKSICQNDGLREKPTKRYCPLCNDNITWLPKYATCPKCGFKPISYTTTTVEEKPYDDALTAHDILLEYYKNNNNSNAQENEMKQSTDVAIKNCRQAAACRCTCKIGKTCAHCRVKKLCEDIFQSTHKGDGDCGKCETNSSDLYSICKASSSDCRPYLPKVLQELKDLFDTSKAEKKHELVDGNDELENISNNFGKVNECQEVNQSEKNVRKSHGSQTSGRELNGERKPFLAKNFKGHVSCKNKIFNYNNHRKSKVMKSVHKNCLLGETIVPRNMGWLWNIEAKGLRTGWMPGAIRKSIKVLMQHFLNKNVALQINEKSNENHDKEEKDYTKDPTLHICKKNGAYFITLRPLVNAGTTNECTERVTEKPIQFKITKNPISAKIRQLKQDLKDLGFNKCSCHKPISKCCCRSYLEKKKLEYRCMKECHKRELSNCTDNLILSDTTDSEAEFQFGVTPPAGVVVPDPCLKKKEKVNSGTQYVVDDWKITQKYRKTPGKLYNCAIGYRFGKEFGPYGTKGYSAGAFPMEGTYVPSRTIPKYKKGKTGTVFKETAIRGPQPFRGVDGKFNMAQYIAYKALDKPSPAEIADKKRKRMALLKGANPPLLCKVDRRGKPTAIPCLPPSCNTCFSDNRIC